MADAPAHLDWLQDTGKTLETVDGLTIEIWELKHADDEEILSAWAKHFREHYCTDEDLPDLIEGTGLTKGQFLTNIKFPDAKAKPGPSTRAGDFSEILVADYIEYVLGYWCPRQVRYEDRFNRNVSTNGCDILGFKLKSRRPGNPDDELFLLEAKAGFTATNSNRLQQAIDGSIKDMTREAMSLNAIKQRLRRTDRSQALLVQRFQSEGDLPFRRINGAAAVLDDEAYAKMDLEASDASEHPNSENLILIVIKGASMMKLVHALYKRAADEA